MARTETTIITPDMGTATVSHGSRRLTFTVTRGALALHVKNGLFPTVSFNPVGTIKAEGTMTDTNTPTPDGYVITLTDTRTPQQRMYA
jgi:hypothetical protein